MLNPIRRFIFRWFNIPADPNLLFVVDRKGGKHWLAWEQYDSLHQLYLLNRKRCVGRVNLLFREGGGVELTDLIIFPTNGRQRSNRRRGLGKAMVQEAIRYAKAQKAKYLFGWIQPDETTSIKYLQEWYQRQGFTLTGAGNRKIHLPLDL